MTEKHVPPRAPNNLMPGTQAKLSNGLSVILWNLTRRTCRLVSLTHVSSDD